MPTVRQTQAILLGYFQTGQVPTQDQYAELIGTMFFLYNETVNNAAAAAASAAAAAASAAAEPAAFASVDFSTASPYTLLGAIRNIASVTQVSFGGGFTTVQ